VGLGKRYAENTKQESVKADNLFLWLPQTGLSNLPQELEDSYSTCMTTKGIEGPR